MLCGWAISWVAAEWLIVSAPLERADAIMVLSGSVTLEERVQMAASLYREGRAPKILLTNDNLQGGWSPKLQRNPYSWEFAVGMLTRWGVPRESIEVLPEPVNSTNDEAVLLRQYSEAHGLRSILVVTSAYHTRRALWTMRHAFENSGVIAGIVAVPPGHDSPWPSTWWLHRRGWRMVAGEYLKMVYYRIAY